MAQTRSEKTDPALWERTKADVTAGDHGGRAGEWSARKAQMAVQKYKAAGGGYSGPKSTENHLAQWTAEQWGTKSGGASLETGERYLPAEALGQLTEDEYRRTSDKKKCDLAAGRQHSAQPADVAHKVAGVRLEQLSLVDLRERARTRGVQGRSRMKKAALVAALA